MIEVLQFIFGSFWKFAGTVVLLAIMAVLPGRGIVVPADILTVLAELRRLQAAEREREELDNSFCKECERHAGTVLEEKHCDQWPENPDETCRCCDRCRVRCAEVGKNVKRVKTKSGWQIVMPASRAAASAKD